MPMPWAPGSPAVSVFLHQKCTALWLLASKQSQGSRLALCEPNAMCDACLYWLTAWSRNLRCGPHSQKMTTELQWEDLDARKFFIQGVALFSGVTSLLFPLSVLKTRQMADHSLPGGFEGTRQTAATIWRQEGIPGFYRGFSTVIFGTIPARSVYLTTLEVTKSATTKLGQQLELSETTTAGIANAAGGAAASLSTQIITVPIDVVSQRQIVHGTDTSPMPAGMTRRRSKRPVPPTPAAGSPPSQAATSSSHISPPMQQQQQVPSHTSSPSAPSSSSSSGHTSSSGASGSSSSSNSIGGQRSYHTSQCSSRGTGGHNAGTTQGTLQPRQLASPTLRQTSWHLLQQQHPWLRHCAGQAGQGAAGGAGAGAGSQVVRLSGIECARMIIKEEGISGLYRGFGMSVVTFVPSSAIWWAAYGVFNKLLQPVFLDTPSSTASSSSHPALEEDVGKLVAMQTTASMLAGATSSVLTNPLDLIKTRIQVARKAEGQVATFREVVQELLREDGPAGFFRGVLPRMASSALWGTAMVTVYEFLKRISRKDDAQLHEQRSS